MLLGGFCCGCGLVWCGDHQVKVKDKETPQNLIHRLSTFERERMKGTRGAVPKPERRLWRILFIFVTVKGFQLAWTRQPETTETRRWNAANTAGTLARDDIEKPRMLLKTWPVFLFSRLIPFQTEHWLGFPLFPVQKSVRLMERYQQSRKKDSNELSAAHV